MCLIVFLEVSIFGIIENMYNIFEDVIVNIFVDFVEFNDLCYCIVF